MADDLGLPSDSSSEAESDSSSEAAPECEYKHLNYEWIAKSAERLRELDA